MYILAYFTNSGVPATGLSPTINIRRVEDGALLINSDTMYEIGDGFYGYEYTDYDPDVPIAIRCDGGPSLSDSDRYTYGTNESYTSDIDHRLSTIHGFGIWEDMDGPVFGDFVFVDNEVVSAYTGSVGMKMYTEKPVSAKLFKNDNESLIFLEDLIIKEMVADMRWYVAKYISNPGLYVLISEFSDGRKNINVAKVIQRPSEFGAAGS